MTFWRSFKSEFEAETLTIYLRSGSEIVLDRVTEWTIKNQGNEIVSISLTQSRWAKRKLLVKTIDLSQIVAITKSK